MNAKNTGMKAVWLVLSLAALAVSCLMYACSSPVGNETGKDSTFSITINGGSGRSVEFLSWEPGIKVADLDHTITLTNGPGPDIEWKDVKAGQTVQFKVTPGYWDITVKAYLDDVLKAEGFAGVNLKPGPNEAVLITMGPPVSASTTFPITMLNDGNGTAAAEPESAAAGVTVNIQAEPRNGFMFDEWEIVSGGVTLSGMKENPASFTMPQGPVTIKACFEVVPPGTPVLSLSPVTFNPVTLGYDQPAAHIVTIHNSGTETANVSSITLGGTNADSFTLDGNLTPAIAALESAVFTVRPVIGLGAGTYGAKIIASYSGGVVTSHTAETDISFTVNAHVTAAPPAISGHPQSAVYSQNANAIPLTVTALSTDGGELFYQWYRNETGSTTGGTLVESGSDKSSYTPGTASIGVFYYYCVVINTIPDNHDGGIKSASVTSNAAMVTVNNLVNAATPSITVQPVATTSITIGGTVKLSITASKADNGALTYQWYYSHSTASNSNGSIIDDATSDSYTTPGTLMVGNHYYYCVVTNTIADNGDGGNKTAPKASDVATVTVTLPVIDISAIEGVTPPVTGETPVTTINANDQFTGTVEWSPNDAPFAPGKQYTATITLTAKDGYTLQGVSANFFTVAGTSTPAANAASSGEITAVFPETPFNVYDESTWKAACTAISAGDNGKNYTINVKEGFDTSVSGTSATFGSFTGSVTITGDKIITLVDTGSLLSIGANQTVIIRDTDFEGNSGNNTSLVYMNGDNARLTMEGNSSVSNNINTSANSYGGGVYVNGTGAIFTMEDNAAVSGNTAKVDGAAYGSDYGGGGVYVVNGSFTMRDSAKVSDNTSTGNYVSGGGVYIAVGGSFTMWDNAAVSGNKTTDLNGQGGGVRVMGGSFSMQDNATVSNNKTTGSVITNTATGAGVYVGNSGSFIMGDKSAVSYNTGPGPGSGYGGGVAVCGTGSSFIMEGNAQVHDNSSVGMGGGVHIEDGSFTMRDDAMVFNHQCSGGAGVFVRWDANAVMEGNAKIFNNIANSSGGGGVSLQYRVSFIMRGNAEIYNNQAKGTSSWGGAGVYMYNSGSAINFTMEDNAQIHDNTSVGGGGGVQAYTQSINFTMAGNSKVYKNSCAEEGGGGVQIRSAGSNFTMRDSASVFGNTASTSGSSSGGGVYNNGTFIMEDDATVSGNTVNGLNDLAGGVYVFENGTFTMRGSASVSGNIANFTGTNGISSGGVAVKDSNKAIFRIEGGTIYGSNAAASLANTCTFKGTGSPSNYFAALYKGSNGTAQRGTINASTGAWNNLGAIANTNNTIRIVNGVVQ